MHVLKDRYQRYMYGVLAILVTCLSACILSPPIEPVAVDQNYPPFIDVNFVQPDRDIVRVEPQSMTNGNNESNNQNDNLISLSVEMLLDPNPEDVLYYAWIGKRSGLIEQSESTRKIDQTTLFRGIFFQYERAAIDIDPCSDRLRGVDDETIWLYVADKRFTRLSADVIEVEQGGFIYAHSWILEFTPTLCLNR